MLPYLEKEESETERSKIMYSNFKRVRSGRFGGIESHSVLMCGEKAPSPQVRDQSVCVHVKIGRGEQRREKFRRETPPTFAMAQGQAQHDAYCGSSTLPTSLLSSQNAKRKGFHFLPWKVFPHLKSLQTELALNLLPQRTSG